MPNTFPRAYLNSKPIFLVVRSMVLPQEDAIYMVLRSLQKLGGNSDPCVHSGNSTVDSEFNSCVLFLNLNNNYFNTCLYIHHLSSFVP